MHHVVKLLLMLLDVLTILVDLDHRAVGHEGSVISKSLHRLFVVPVSEVCFKIGLKS